MTKRWIYALMVATIIVVGAIAGPVMAATGTTAVPAPVAPASAVMGPEAGTNGISPAGYIYSQDSTPPDFEWVVISYGSDTVNSLVYTVPTGYKLQIDDITIQSYSPGINYNTIWRGTAGTTLALPVVLSNYSHYDQSFNNLVFDSGEQIRVRTSGSGYSFYTITAHWM